MIKYEEKTCSDCKNAKLLKRDSKFPTFRTEHSDYECVGDKVTLALMDKYNWKLGRGIAEECPSFDSIELRQHCMICGELIVGKKFSWPYWAIGIMEDIPTCSEKCKKILQKKLDKQGRND
ncbi:MAG: hypothetical protein ACOCRK_05730 [bacterium]